MTAALPYGPECWRRIGVLGDAEPSCERLTELVHCRNCDVYGEAGRALLDRQPPDDYVREQTSLVAARRPQLSLEGLSVLIFRIEGEWLALPARAFVEVTEDRPIHRVPHRGDDVLLGLVNIRGRLHLCVSLARLLGLDPAPASIDRLSHVVYRRLMVIGAGEQRWAFPVDEVYGMRRFPPGSVHEAPVTVSRDKASCTKGLLALQEGLLFLTERRKSAAVQFSDKQVGYLDDQLLLQALERRVLADPDADDDA